MSNRAVVQSKQAGRPKISLRALYDELHRLRQRVEDLEDLRELNEAITRHKGKRLIPWDEAKKDLEI